jgi:hypothetical protein
MCGQKLVHNAPRRRIEDLNSSLVVAENNSMLTNSQPRNAYEAAMEGFDVAASFR